jgi:hypothetical protein
LSKHFGNFLYQKNGRNAKQLLKMCGVASILLMRGFTETPTNKYAGNGKPGHHFLRSHFENSILPFHVKTIKIKLTQMSYLTNDSLLSDASRFQKFCFP